MNQPLGAAVGNALEVREAIDTLQGGGPPDFREHCLVIGGKMLELAGKANNLDAAKQMLAGSLDGGDSDPVTDKRLAALAETLNGIAAKLR
jgi:pyrimidine-nucleoside phosphorylase